MTRGSSEIPELLELLMAFYNELSCWLGEQLFFLNICHRAKKQHFFLMITVPQFPGKAHDADRTLRNLKRIRTVLFEPCLYNLASKEREGMLKRTH